MAIGAVQPGPTDCRHEDLKGCCPAEPAARSLDFVFQSCQQPRPGRTNEDADRAAPFPAGGWGCRHCNIQDCNEACQADEETTHRVGKSGA